MATRAYPGTTGKQKRIELSDDRAVVVTIRPDSREVDVEADGVRWTFGVDEKHHAELVEIYPPTRDDLPEWVERVLDGMGVEEVEE